MILRYTFSWSLLAIAAIINGLVRQTVYADSLGDLIAHQVSTLTGIVLFGYIIYALGRLWPLPSARQARMVGFIWLALTVAFEFLFGHFVVRHPWSRLAHDYDIGAGRIWLLVLIWLTVAPYFFYRLQQRKQRVKEPSDTTGQSSVT